MLYYNSIKEKKSYLKNILIFLFCINIGFVSSQTTIGTYEKIEKVKKKKFNFNRKVKIRKDRSAKLVFSDRVANKAYTNPYLQQKLEKQDLLTPFYVIDEGNDAYELVVANPEEVGKPKGIFSFLFGKKYTFKDAEKVKYVGWIPKANILEYNHSIIDSKNNRPLKYKVGTSNVKRLFDLRPHLKIDSLQVYKDPFFKVKSASKLVSNQIIYPYKYDQTGKAVLVSDKPIIKDSISQISGWIPADLLTLVGQNQVYKLREIDTIKTVRNRDTISLAPDNIYSKYLYTDYRNAKTNPSSLTIPVYVWDHSKNKLINVNGNTLYTKEILYLKKETKVVNFHFIFREKDKEGLKKVLNSLQKLWLSISEDTSDLQYNFSAIFIGKRGSYLYPKTKSFSNWMDFIETAIESNNEDKMSFKMSILEAIDYSLSNFTDKNKRFENNFFIIAGSDNGESLNTKDTVLINKIARKSSKLLFVQMTNKGDAKHQNFLLNSKEFLYKLGEAYNTFIQEFIVDNKLVIKDNTLKSITSDSDNIYIYDSPNNSLFSGGILFPKIENTLTPISLEMAMDSVLNNTHKTNKKLIASLAYYNKKLGVLRSKPSAEFIRKYYDNLTLKDSIRLSGLNRNNLYEVFYEKVPLLDSVSDKMVKGYILDKQEILTLIDDYRNLLPKFSKPIDRKKRRFLKRFYQKQMLGINKTFLRKVLTRKATMAELFYLKTSYPINHKGYYCLRVNKLPRKRIAESGFEKFYFKQRKKVDILEQLFLKGKLHKVEEGYKKEVYFIPNHLML